MNKLSKNLLIGLTVLEMLATGVAAYNTIECIKYDDDISAAASAAAGGVCFLGGVAFSGLYVLDKYVSKPKNFIDEERALEKKHQGEPRI